MDGLFSAVELRDAEAEQHVGYRLERLELRNWGTFDRRVWDFGLDGCNALLTGDIGSGKSTIVDAITTLLLPAHRVAYNKAAGAETKERSLRSYVCGYYKAERSETSGTSRPVGLRKDDSYSVILGVFRNRGYGITTTLAQVFWTRPGHQGQPERFFVIADGDRSIAADFTDFGADIASLRKRLRNSGALVRDHFPEYGKEYRRRLGIESEQAMELFHQTVSMKSVGDLNDFVRNHMLEPFDTNHWIDQLVSHFEDLTRAHDAVVRARDQLADLAPLLADCDQFGRLANDIASLAAERAAVRFYCADRKAELLERRIVALRAAIQEWDGQIERIDKELHELRRERQQLEIERAGHGGNRIGELERLIDETTAAAEACRRKLGQFNDLLAEAGLEQVGAAEQFAARRRQASEALVSVANSVADLQNQLTDKTVERKQVAAEGEEINAELRSLQGRRNNIPRRNLELRQALCDALQVDAARLPFVGELIQVRSGESAWEGAAERVLRGFGLSILVGPDQYPAVSEWINEHHLSGRVVYYRVPHTLAPSRADGVSLGDSALIHKLEVADSPFAAWIDRELTRRAGHECVETMAEFRREGLAVTRAGQIKSPGGRHEKNDTTRIGDRASYILGWSNQQKIEVLIRAAKSIQDRLNKLTTAENGLREQLDAVSVRHGVLAKLDMFHDWSELDWETLVNRVAGYQVEKKELERSSGELGRIARRLDAIGERTGTASSERDKLLGDKGRDSDRLANAERAIADARRLLETSDRQAIDEASPRIEARLRGSAPAEPEGYDRIEADLQNALTELVETKTRSQNQVAGRAVSRMRDFRQAYPSETAELDDSMESAVEYRAMDTRLRHDDLPRFEAEFKSYLNTNVIRDVAGFQGQLTKQAELIRSRVDTINDSLVSIDYNQDRYIRLESNWTPNLEVREFRNELRACTDNSLSGDDPDQYSEQKFLQVKRIIERFKGRAGQTELDRAWTRRVTDVRNWFLFSASERWRADDQEHEHYTDSGGKSGGQKEKLAYTILAASLAYQFKLEWGATRSKTFRFVVIDEAFGRGSDESTRFALSLFQRLGLQLLIVTPLQKIHVIEPYVSAVGFVDNPSGAYSRLQTLTIAEYRERQLAHALGRLPDQQAG